MSYEFKTKKANVLYLMGCSGMTVSDPKPLKDLADVVSEHFNVNYKSATNDIYSHTPKRSKNPNIEAVDVDGAACYQFTSAGYAEYTKLRDEVAKIDNGSYVGFREWRNKYYPNLVADFQTMLDNGEAYISIDFEKLVMFDSLVKDEMLILTEYHLICEKLETYIRPVVEAHFGEYKEYKEQLDKFHIRISNIPSHYTTNVESIYQHDMGDFVAISGRVAEMSPVDKHLTNAVYQCLRCETTQELPQDPFEAYVEPSICEGEYCGKKGPFILLEDQCEWVNVQQMVIVSNTQINGSAKIPCYAMGELCTGSMDRLGKNVVITGHLKAIQKLTKNRKKSSNFEHVLMVTNIINTDDSLTQYPSAEECELFEQMAAQKDATGLSIVHEELFVKCCAPNIYGREDIKNIATLPLFSDWTWNAEDVGSNRSSAHVLLLGPPGTGKSDIMKDILRISPKGFGPSTYKAGQMSSGVGLMSVTERSEIDGKWMVSPGFLAQGDRSVVGLDEIDKIPGNDLDMIAPVLEDQTQDIAKAGSAKFNSRCAVIMTANPNNGNEIDPNIPVIDQFECNLFMKQRIDAIVYVPEITDPLEIEKAANAVLDSDFDPESHAAIKSGDPYAYARPFDIGTIRKYIMYARSKPIPKITEEVKTILKNHYIEIKRSTNGSRISLRSLKSYKRIARAIARRELAEEVTPTHAYAAINMMESAIRSIAGTMEDGTIDYAVYEVGQSRSQTEHVKMIKELIGDGYEEEEVLNMCLTKGYEHDHTRGTVAKMLRRGELLKRGNGKLEVIR